MADLAPWVGHACVQCIAWASGEPFLIRCGPGLKSVHSPGCQPAHSVSFGEKIVPEIDNPGRELILQRIRSALAVPTPRPDGDGGASLFAAVPDALDRFQKECSTNRTECVLTPGTDASATAIAGILASLPPGEIFVQDHPQLRQMALAWPEDRGFRWSSDGGPHEHSQATVTLADWLVAETGSVLVSSSCGGRAATIAAPVHIVVADQSQLVPDLATVFSRIRENGTAQANSMLCLITGSSRTADIEKILVMGAHGPRRLVVVLAECSVAIPASEVIRQGGNQGMRLHPNP